MADGYRPGRHIVVCDITGQEVWDDQVKKQWDGSIVRAKSWSRQHPQERIRVRPERGAVFPARPVLDPQFVTIPQVYGFDHGFHFNFAPSPPENSNYTYIAGGDPVTGTADSFFSVTADAKWHLNGDGLLVRSSANSLVREFDPNGHFLGLCVETGKTNLGLHTEDFSNVVYTKDGLTASSNVIAGPDGTLTADKLVSDNSLGNDHFLAQNITFVAGTVYTLSYFVHEAELFRFALQFGAAAFASVPSAGFNLRANGGAGAATFQSGTIVGTPQIRRLGGGWYRISMSATATSSATASTRLFLSTSDVSVVYDGDGVSGAYATRLQCEAGRAASSHIQCAAAPVARASDRISRTLGLEFDRSRGTFFARYLLGVGNKGANQFVLYTSDNSYVNSAALFSSAAGLGQLSVNSGGGFAGLSTMVPVLGDRSLIRHIGAWAVNDVQVGVNGAFGNNDLAAPVPLALNRMDLGCDQNGVNAAEVLWLQEAHYWPERKTNTYMSTRMAA